LAAFFLGLTPVSFHNNAIKRLTKVYKLIRDINMEKQLNLRRISSAMDEHGLNQARLSKELGVSRTIVSSWFKGRKFPRPDKLLKLGLVLGLSFNEIIQKSVTAKEPIIAFRKKGTRITRDDHIDKAKEMGQLLELLVPYIPNDRMFQSPALKNPKLEYHYIQKVANSVREEIGVKNGNPIEFARIIEKINEFEVILIPVFHGNKENHENALHIFLPSSNTTWIYLNLDSNVHDFKFWMSHELGHMLSPSLSGEVAEDFADTFAQALLFSEDQAESTYNTLRSLRNSRVRIKRIIEISEDFTISPVTVYKSINNFATENGKKEIFLEPDIYASTTRLNKNHANVSDALIKKKSINAKQYIEISKNVFNSPFFDIVRMFLSENDKSAGFIQSIIDTSILDAKELHAELVK
jgi:transcriptional regulator with XRE-family HTH domain